MTIFFSTMTGLFAKLCTFLPFQMFGCLLLVGGCFRLFWRFFFGSPEKAPNDGGL